MKNMTLALLALFFLPVISNADEVALIRMRVGKERPYRAVALEFFEGEAPLHVSNFKRLARKRFYDGLAFHRVFPHLLVQVGDPLSEGKDRSKVGTGGPGYTVAPEIRRKHTVGAVAAARLPDKLNPSRLSNASQFYVCLAPMPNLDGQYTVFGRVLYGLETLDLISSRPVDSNDYPVDRIEVKSIRIFPREQLPPPPTDAPRGAVPGAKRWWQIFG